MPPICVAFVTFDDGNLDYYHLAYPVLKEFGMSAVLVSDSPASEDGPDYWTASTDQVIVTTNRKLLEAEPIHSVATEIQVPPGFRVWTDDFNNLLRVLK